MTAEEREEEVRRLEEAWTREQAVEKILHLRRELGIDICLLQSIVLASANIQYGNCRSSSVLLEVDAKVKRECRDDSSPKTCAQAPKRDWI